MLLINGDRNGSDHVAPDYAGIPFENSQECVVFNYSKWSNTQYFFEFPRDKPEGKE